MTLRGTMTYRRFAELHRQEFLFRFFMVASMCVMCFLYLRNRLIMSVENLRIPQIFLNTHTHIASRVNIQKVFSFQRISWVFNFRLSSIPSPKPYHTTNLSPPVSHLWQERFVFSSGTWSTDMSCLYAAGMFLSISVESSNPN